MDQRNIKDEYDAQLYGFTTTGVVDGISEAFDSILELTFEDLQKKLSLKVKTENQESLNQMVKNWQKGYAESAEKGFKDLKSLVDEFFEVKDFVLLPEDKEQIHQYSEEYEEELDKKLDKAKTSLKELCKLEELLVDSIKTTANYKELVGELTAVSQSLQDVEKSSLKSQIEVKEFLDILEMNKSLKEKLNGSCLSDPGV